MVLDEQIELFKSSVKNLRKTDGLSKSLIFINMGQNDIDLNKKLGYNASLDMGQYLAKPLSKRLQVNTIYEKKILINQVLILQSYININ